MKIIIVGGGVSGLAAAIHLHRQGHDIQVLEASDRVGGRIKTDQEGGFLLDHGFQVLLTAYPEARKMLDYQSLDLKKFEPGAVLLAESGRMHTISDPLRNPSRLLSTLFSPAGTLLDKLALLRLRFQVMRGTPESLLTAPETTALQDLKQSGIGPRLLERFFEPFFRGIFLSDLSASSRMFRFVFRMFSEGYATLPAKGMEEIPRQLASRLPAGAIRCYATVDAIEDNAVVLTSGERLVADQVVLALNPGSPLVRKFVPASPRRDKTHSTTCMYFSAPAAPIHYPTLLLGNGKDRLVNHAAVLSNVAPSYAPPGKALISVSLANHVFTADPEKVLGELSRHTSTQGWQHLRTFYIPGALPDQQHIDHTYQPRLNPFLVYAGDYALYGSLNAALVSGRMAAEAILGHPIS